VTKEAAVSDSPSEIVRVGVLILVSALELVTSEVTMSGTLGEITLVGTAELASFPGLVAVEGVVSDLLWGKYGTVVVMVGLVSAGWVIHDSVVSVSPGEIVTVGIAELTSALGWVTHESVVAG
jgi:hypothetical protein